MKCHYKNSKKKSLSTYLLQYGDDYFFIIFVIICIIYAYSKTYA